MIDFIRACEEKVIQGQEITYEETLSLINTEETNELFAAANRIRKHFKANRFDLCSIMNAKSGKCSEDCKYCAQSAHYSTGVVEYPLVSVEEVLKLAKENEQNGVHRFALVTSGKAVTDAEFEQVIEIFKTLRRETKLHLCTSLGCITHKQAKRLKDAGVTMYHHNVETSRDFFANICTTHTYQDRVDTIKDILAAGLNVCSGGIIGLGETVEDRVKMAFEIKALGVKSVPLNFLCPIKGTPLQNMERIKPLDALKTIAMFRFVIPDALIRYAGGRDALGDLQALGLQAGVNAALVGNLLTTIGNKIPDDLKMIKAQGMEL